MTSPLPAAVVTGASRGIGLAIARALAPTHHVWVGGTTADAVGQVVSQLPSASPFIADLADAEATARAAAEVSDCALLVHSAGIALSGDVEHDTRDDFRRILELNVVAVADLTRLLLPQLVATAGQIVAINSGAGFTSGSGGSLYSASKFALRAWTDAAREDLRGRVRVTSIHPGRTDSDMQRDLQSQLGRPYVTEEHLRPESVAEAVMLAVNASAEAMVEELSIRPVFKA